MNQGKKKLGSRQKQWQREGRRGSGPEMQQVSRKNRPIRGNEGRREDRAALEKQSDQVKTDTD